MGRLSPARLNAARSSWPPFPVHDSWPMILNPSHPSSFPPSPPAFRFPPAVEPALRVSRAPSEGTTAANAQHRSFYLFQPTPSAFVFPLLSNQRRSARSCAQALLARSPSGCSADEGVKKQEERREKKEVIFPPSYLKATPSTSHFCLLDPPSASLVLDLY